MRAGRRDFLLISALVGSGLLSGCSRIVKRFTGPGVEDVALPAGETEPVVRLLNRVAFGPRPGEVSRVRESGVAAYIEEQLNTVEEDERGLTIRLRGIDALHGNPIEMRDLRDEVILEQLQQAALLSAVYSRHQLRERMADFWSNHFNVYGYKGLAGYFKPVDEMQIIRTHALGKFPDLLYAMAHSPAMLIYLDNASNARGVPNENYARELMELHTMGVNGGYTQKDVQELARCLTGWTVEDRFLHRQGTFRFDADRHDDGPKILLEMRLPASGGERDGEKALELLAKHPSTARHLSKKLCRYFVGDDAGEWPEKLAAIYRETGGDLRAMLRPLLTSEALLNAPPLLKRPFDYVVSSLRALHADTDGGKPLQEHLKKMGQPLYQWPMPDGYPDKTSAWTGSLLARWNFALSLTAGEISGTTAPLSEMVKPDTRGGTELPDALIELIFSHRATVAPLKPLRESLHEHSKVRAPQDMNEATALCLASPAFQWR
jgi:hypothetical protein